MANIMDYVIDYSIPKKGDIKKYSNYRTISLISHSSKFLLRVILNRLPPQEEQILEEASFRKNRRTIEQILNCRLLMEEHINQHIKLYQDLIDFSLNLLIEYVMVVYGIHKIVI